MNKVSLSPVMNKTSFSPSLSQVAPPILAEPYAIAATQQAVAAGPSQLRSSLRCCGRLSSDLVPMRVTDLFSDGLNRIGEDNMKRKAWICGALVACLWLGYVLTASARPVQSWSAKELWESAHLVVIGRVQSTDDAKDWDYPNLKDDTWIAVNSTFEVQAVLKGALESKNMTLRHFRYRNKRAETFIDGPLFVEFDPKRKNQYLMFLKRGEKGLYEPLTGQYAPYQSFKLLQDYHISHER